MSEVHKKTAQRLRTLLEADFDVKLRRSKKKIREALRTSDNPVISSSFGKDSVSLIHLVHSIDDSVPIVFNNTGVQFPESIEFKNQLEEKWNLEVRTVTPEKSFWEIVEEYGYPKESRNSKTGDKRKPKCCKILKEDPMKNFIDENNIDMDFVGLTGDEGRQRRWVYINKGCSIYEHKSWNTEKCIPLIWWKQEDVWKYIEKNNLPVNPAYEKYDIERTGCITCTGHKNWQEKLNKTFPNLYNKIMNDMGRKTLRELPTASNGSCEED